MSNLDADALDALRSSYDFSSLPPLPPQHLGMMMPPHQQQSHHSQSSSIPPKNLHPQQHQQHHQAYTMDGTLDTFQNQSAHYYNDKGHHDFATSTTTPATDLGFGNQWAQQQQHQQAAVAGGVIPVQSKKQK
ncbi:hypothetical protein BGZ95_002190 [Linnemannia exigua]|uniref:Uncharacterized protein n=1 Tax=Linnemannia exigua TaxID=604196 RepID=A0AAD4D5V5_9FUNG|nr:hypothetical protein BGZ95_002190 [Linnemannia exigua]